MEKEKKFPKFEDARQKAMESRPKKAAQNERRFVYFAAISVVMLMLGGIISGYTGIVATTFGIMEFNLTGILELAALTFTVFLMCALFFGRASHIAMLLAGFLLYGIATESVFLAITAGIGFIIAGYGGKLLGEMLYKDFKGEANFYEDKNIKSIAFYLGLGIIVSVLGFLAKQYFREAELAIRDFGRGVKGEIIGWLSAVFGQK